MNKSNYAGFSLATMCFIVFVVLLVFKLSGQNDMSWWWVTAPVWGFFVFLFGVLGLLLVILGAVALVAIIAEVQKNKH